MRVGVTFVGILSVGLRVLSAVGFDRFVRVLVAILGNRIAVDVLVGLDALVASVLLGGLMLVLSVGLGLVLFVLLGGGTPGRGGSSSIG